MPSPQLDPVAVAAADVGSKDAYALLVSHPPEVRQAVVHCTTTHGNVQISQRGATDTTQVIRPDSPLYNLTNTACGGHITCALAEGAASSSVVALTLTNNAAADGHFVVAVALSYARKAHELVSVFSGTIAAGKSCFVFVTFLSVSVSEL
jgi:hypothetical protein